MPLLTLISKVIEKVILDQTIFFLYSTNVLYFYFKWQKEFRKRFDNWHDSDWFTKDLWYNWPLHATTKFVCYWFLWIFSELVSIIDLIFSTYICVHWCMVKNYSWFSTLSHIYMSIICHKLSNVILFFMLMVHVWLVNQHKWRQNN